MSYILKSDGLYVKKIIDATCGHSHPYVQYTDSLEQAMPFSDRKSAEYTAGFFRLEMVEKSEEEKLEKLKRRFKSEMNECLECINADGQIKRVEIDEKTKEVKFVFNYFKIDDETTWVAY